MPVGGEAKSVAAIKARGSVEGLAKAQQHATELKKHADGAAYFAGVHCHEAQTVHQSADQWHHADHDAKMAEEEAAKARADRDELAALQAKWRKSSEVADCRREAEKSVAAAEESARLAKEAAKRAEQDFIVELKKEAAATRKDIESADDPALAGLSADEILALMRPQVENKTPTLNFSNVKNPWPTGYHTHFPLFEKYALSPLRLHFETVEGGIVLKYDDAKKEDDPTPFKNMLGFYTSEKFSTGKY